MLETNACADGFECVESDDGNYLCERSIHTCGDGIVNGDEACDEPDASPDCAYGEETCTVCNAECQQVNGNTHSVVMVS